MYSTPTPTCTAPFYTDRLHFADLLHDPNSRILVFLRETLFELIELVQRYLLFLIQHLCYVSIYQRTLLLKIDLFNPFDFRDIMHQHPLNTIFQRHRA